MPLKDPDELPLVVELPVSRPEASRNWVFMAISRTRQLLAIVEMG